MSDTPRTDDWSHRHGGIVLPEESQQLERELTALKAELESVKAERDAINRDGRQLYRTNRALLDALESAATVFDEMDMVMWTGGCPVNYRTAQDMACEILNATQENASDQETRKEGDDTCAQHATAISAVEVTDQSENVPNTELQHRASKGGSGDVPALPQPAEATPETGLQDSNTLEPMPESCAACEACHGLSSASMIRNPAKWFVTLAFASKLERQRNYWKRHYYEKEKPTRALAEQLAAERAARQSAEARLEKAETDRNFLLYEIQLAQTMDDAGRLLAMNELIRRLPGFAAAMNP